MLREDGGIDEAEQRADGGNTLPPFDAQKYRDELHDLDLTEDQATEFLRALDFILRSFIDLGWGVDSVQNFIPAMKEISSQFEADDLEQKENTNAFNSAALRGKEE